MESFLMNVIGVAAIAAMLYGIWVMWRNIDRELHKIEVKERSLKPKTEQNKKSGVGVVTPLPLSYVLNVDMDF